MFLFSNKYFFIKNLKMLFKFLLKNQSILLYIELFFLLQIGLVSSDETTINEKNLKFICINNNIIFIKQDSGDKNIYKFTNSVPSKLLENQLYELSSKSITKLDDEHFVIFGINSHNYFCFQSFELTNSGVTLEYSNDNTNIRFNNGDNYNIACSSKTICFISFADSNGFHVYKIVLNGNVQTITTINMGYIPTYEYNNIICDSFDGDNIFCIYMYKNGDSWMNLYVNGDSSTGLDGTKSKYLCDSNPNCCSGNIIKEKETNRYLVCYEILETHISIVCKYFSFQEGIILIDDEYQVAKNIAFETRYYKTLMLYVYENTVVIELESIVATNRVSRLFICSLDLKITIMKKLEADSLDNLFNDDENYYFTFENSVNTIVQKEKFIKCNDKKYIYFSENSEEVFDFASNHRLEKIIFSLDKSTKLKKGNTLVISRELLSLGDNPQFKFLKPVETNALKNYYCYNEPDTGSESSDYYKKFSLICPITLKLCNERCESCNLNKPSISTENFCKECNADYYPKNTEAGNSDGFNCYKKGDKEIESYYFKDNKFFQCDPTCKTCQNSTSCDTCQDGYYFKKENDGTILKYEKCFKNIRELYYLDTSGSEWYYRPCYDSCKTCSSSGTPTHNNCNDCKNEYTTYDFDKEQCTIDKDSCITKNKYWVFQNNNIECKEVNDCKGKSLIIDGDNRGQCVDDCKTFEHPFKKTSVPYLYTFQCVEQKYCLTSERCTRQSLIIDYYNNKCVTKMICKGEMDIFSGDPFDNIEFLPLPLPTDHSSPDERKDEINTRIKVIKMFSEEEESYSDVLSKYHDSDNLLRNYITILQNELSNYGQDTKIFLITSTKYMNFTITIYPLDIENFVYEQIFTTNNLAFANFTKMYENFINYEANSGELLLICLLEYHSKNSAIDDLNYFIYSLNEISYTGYVIYPSGTDILPKFHSQLEISYSLSNYNNTNSKINQRNKEYLVDNIKEMALNYPEVNLSNISDPFYNDLCFLFTSDVNTDMTLNDRRNEYYVNVSLCENNCQIITILNKEVKNPRSLCSCDMKTRVLFNTNPGLEDDIPLISSHNSKAVTCISTTFNKNTISSNIIFWILLIALLFLIAMVVAWILFGNKEIKKNLGIYGENNDVSDLKLSISNEENEKVLFSKENSINQNVNKKKNLAKKKAKKKELAKSEAIRDKKDKRYSMESQRIEYLSAPINFSNPPKKKEDKKDPTLATIDYNEKDLITNSEPSFFKNSILKANDANEKNDGMTDFSFDNMPSDNKVYIDNLLKQRYMLENNYIKNPIEFEKMQKMQILYRALYSPEDIEQRKICHSCDAIHFPKNYKKNNVKPKNNKIPKNKLITALLGGEDLFNDKQSNNNQSDKNDIKKLQKNKEVIGNINTSFFKEEKDFDGDEQFFFPGGILGKEGGNLLIDDDNNNIFNQKENKNTNKNNIKKQLNKIENNKNDESENENENENKNQNNDEKKIQKNKNKNKNTQMIKENLNKNTRNRLLKSIGKSNLDDSEEKKDGKNGDKNCPLKTEYDIDVKNKIKQELKKLQTEKKIKIQKSVFSVKIEIIKIVLFQMIVIIII